jgi:hypothetical protein
MQKNPLPPKLSSRPVRSSRVTHEFRSSFSHLPFGEVYLPVEPQDGLSFLVSVRATHLAAEPFF